MPKLSKFSAVSPALCICGAAAVVAGVTLPAASASAQNFLNELFSNFGFDPRPPIFRGPMPGEGMTPQAPPPPPSKSTSTAFCVRTCDGRHFPLTTGDSESRAAVCSSLCPASETKVFFGSSIERSETSNGEPYTKLKNAFRYRTEIDPKCTCDGKNPGGLTHIDVSADPTVRKGDIIASDDKMTVIGHSARTKRASHSSRHSLSPSVRSSRALAPREYEWPPDD